MYSRYKRFSRYGSQILTHELKDVDFNRDIEQGPVVKFKVPRKGDLFKEIFFHCKISPASLDGASYSTARGVSFATPLCFYMFQKIDLVIGDTIIETLTPDYMHCMLQLTNNEYVNDGMAYSVGNIRSLRDSFQVETSVDGLGLPNNLTHPIVYSTREYMYALPFYFHKNPSYAFPLCALTEQEVEIHFHLRGLYNLIECLATSGNPTDVLDELQVAALENCKIEKFEVLVDYVYLEEEERTKIMNTPLTYFINQNQLQREDVQDYASINLRFINPIKELIFFRTDRRYTDQQYKGTLGGYKTLTNHYVTFRGTNKRIDENPARKDTVVDIELVVDNEVLLSNTIANYVFLNQIQPFLNHTMLPKPSTVRTMAYIYNYSFAKDPENNLPTGYFNPNTYKEFKMNVVLYPDNDIQPLFIYARTINIMTIHRGQFSLLFENPQLKDFY